MTNEKKSAICMYPFLPAMRNFDAQLMKQATAHLKTYYEDAEDFSEQFVWMYIFFEQSTTISPEERPKIEEVFKMNGLEQIWANSPTVQEDRAITRADERLQTSRSFVVTVVTARFPSLADQAKQKAASMTQSEALHQLVKHIVTAPDKKTVRNLLQPPDPS